METTDTFPPRPVKPSKYWARYGPCLDGKIWVLRRGIDFEDQPVNVANVIRQLSYRRGLRARISFSHEEGTITVQVIGPRYSDSKPKGVWQFLDLG